MRMLPQQAGTYPQPEAYNWTTDDLLIAELKHKVGYNPDGQVTLSISDILRIIERIIALEEWAKIEERKMKPLIDCKDCKSFVLLDDGNRLFVSEVDMLKHPVYRRFILLCSKCRLVPSTLKTDSITAIPKS